MTELERRALLGDKQAQDECTRKGIVLPCPKCYGSITVTEYTQTESMTRMTFSCDYGCLDVTLNQYFAYNARCREPINSSPLAQWNTRPAPPIGRCVECEKWDEIPSKCKKKVNLIANNPDEYYEMMDEEDVICIPCDTYDLDRLRELVEADKDGRCMVLPCKHGDKEAQKKCTEKRLIRKGLFGGHVVGCIVDDGNCFDSWIIPRYNFRGNFAGIIDEVSDILVEYYNMVGLQEMLKVGTFGRCWRCAEYVNDKCAVSGIYKDKNGFCDNFKERK